MPEVSQEMEEKLNELLDKHIKKEGSAISILQDIQEEFGYISPEAVSWFSKNTGIPESKFYGIATFYAQFYLKPRGKNIVTACCGTACHVKGAERLINSAKRELSLTDADNTTEDKEFTLEQVACVGACSIAPVVIINKKVYGKMTSDKLNREIKALKKL